MLSLGVLGILGKIWTKRGGDFVGVVLGLGHTMSAWGTGLELKALEELGSTGRDPTELEI